VRDASGTISPMCASFTPVTTTFGPTSGALSRTRRTQRATDRALRPAVFMVRPRVAYARRKVSYARLKGFRVRVARTIARAAVAVVAPTEALVGQRRAVPDPAEPRCHSRVRACEIGLRSPHPAEPASNQVSPHRGRSERVWHQRLPSRHTCDHTRDFRFRATRQKLRISDQRSSINESRLRSTR